MTHVQGMSVLSSTTLDWPGTIVLTLFTVWYQLLGCYHPSIHVKKKRSQPYPPSTIIGTDVGSWSCQGYTSGPEWELLISSSARDGRMAD